MMIMEIVIFQQNFPYNFAEKRLKSIAILKKV